MQTEIGIETNASFEKKEATEMDMPTTMGFQRKCPRFIPNSPLFQTLSELIKEQPSFIQTLRIDHIKRKENNEEAFIIHLDNNSIKHCLPEECESFKEYRLQERHFSIDKTYRTSKSHHGLTPLHYTEVYASTKDRKKFIIVHVYSDKQGQLLYTQVKEYNSPEEKSDLLEEEYDPSQGIELKLENESALLKTNARLSMSVMLPLFTERQKRYLNFKKEADTLEAKLSEASRSLTGRDSLAAYKKKAREFIEKINELNNYSELLDPRARWLEVNLEVLEAWSLKVQQAARGKPQSEPPLSLTESIKPIEETQSSLEEKESNELEKLYHALIAELQKLKETLKIGRAHV